MISLLSLAYHSWAYTFLDLFQADFLLRSGACQVSGAKKTTTLLMFQAVCWPNLDPTDIHFFFSKWNDMILKVSIKYI